MVEGARPVQKCSRAVDCCVLLLGGGIEPVVEIKSLFRNLYTTQLMSLVFSKASIRVETYFTNVPFRIQKRLKVVRNILATWKPSGHADNGNTI